MKWITISSSYMSIVRQGTRLICGYATIPDGGGYGVIALEVPAKAEVARDIFDNHAHKALGKRKTVAGAKALATRYAKQWAADRSKRAKVPCSCGPIATKKSRARRPNP